VPRLKKPFCPCGYLLKQFNRERRRYVRKVKVFVVAGSCGNYGFEQWICVIGSGEVVVVAAQRRIV